MPLQHPLSPVNASSYSDFSIFKGQIRSGNVRISAENVDSDDLANRRLQPLGHSSVRKIRYLYVAGLAILTFECR